MGAELWSFPIIGFFIGIIASIFGVGGGFFYTPFYHTFFSLSAAQAVATSMMQIPFQTLSAASVFIARRQFDFFATILLSVSSLITMSFTVHWIIHFDESFIGTQKVFYSLTTADLIVIGTYSIVTLATISYTLISYFRHTDEKPAEEEKKLCRSSAKIISTVFLGIFLGYFSPAAGVGGGFLSVPFFLLYCRMSPSRAVGTSTLYILVVSTLASLQYLFSGIAIWQYALLTAAGALVGAQIGSRITMRLEPRKMKASLAIFQIIILFLYITGKIVVDL